MRGVLLCLRMGIFALMTGSAALLAQVAVTTHHNDLSRTGANLNETILNTSNVNTGTFGKLFSRSVDGQIYAQPLYVPQVTVPGQGVHNVVYVCTEHNSVYAFDADDGTVSLPLWHVNFGPTSNGVSGSIESEVGITSTPVIDLTSNTLYVVSESIPGGTTIFKLHALDLASGNEKFNGPVAIQGSVSGTGSGSIGGTLAFDPKMHWQRTGLLLLNGTVYIGFATHGDDTPPYHGWIFGYNATTLQRTTFLCTTPNGSDGGIWAGGQGLVADAGGNIYVATGNGTMDANSGGHDYGDSFLKLGTTNGLAVLDYFSPSNENTLDIDDADLGASGPVLIPGTSLGVDGGKDGRLFVFNTANLGQFHATDQIVQEWQATFSEISGSGGIFGPDKVYYNSRLYLWGRNDALKAFAFNGTSFNTTPVSKTLFTVADGYSNEPALSISAQGTTAGTGILWASYSANGGADGFAYPGILRAFDASDLTHELWNSNQNSPRDYSGSWAKWCPPTIVNGKVYLATFDNELNVYGLLPLSGSGGSVSGAGNSSTTAANLTTEGPSDWVHWGDAGLNRKAGVTPQISNDTAIGAGALKYSNDPRPLSWSDGTPTVSASNNTDGLYISGIGQGFSLTAPADTTTRTLVVHVGGWSSGGTLTAHLSDRSAADFVSTTTVAPGQYDRNYTLSYNAGSPGQSLTVTWVMSSGTGNVSLNAAALSLPPTSITAIAGTPQTAIVGAATPAALQAKVKDANNNPVAGLQVIFTAPSSGASGSFNGSSTAQVITDNSGVATAPTFIANGQAGSYVVLARVSGVTSAASFSLTNNPLAANGILSGLGTSVSTAANLTTEGTVDWVHWGDTNLNRKAGVGVAAQITSYSVIGSGGALMYSPDPRPLSWTDGTPLASSTNNTNGLYINGVGNGFLVMAPADTGARSLIIHVGGWNSGGTLVAHLSDGSAADFVDTTVNTAGQYNRNYTLQYSAASPGQYLAVAWVMSSGTGNVTINGAALSAGPQGALSGLGNSSSTAANLTAEGPADWVHWGDASLNRKAAVAAQISDETVVGAGSALKYGNDLRSLNWSDGSPTVTATNNNAGLYIYGVGQGFSLTAPANTNTRTLVIHVGGWNSSGTLRAHLSDGSAADFVDTTPSAPGQYDRNYTLTYNAATSNPGLTLKVTWVMSSGTGNVTINGAALQ